MPQNPRDIPKARREASTANARDDVLRRMLKTPPKKHEPIGKRKKRAKDGGKAKPN